MDKKQAAANSDQWLKDIPTSSESVGFEAGEMVACPRCGRSSPPTRSKCLYCAADLPATEAQNQHLKLNSRRLEDWEKGFNVVYLPSEERVPQLQASRLAQLLNLDAEDLEIIFKAGKTLPLARLESELEARALVERLAAIEIDVRVVSDESLRPEIPNRRLRSIEFSEGEIILRLFNTGEEMRFEPEKLLLIVVGAVFERRIESSESIERKKENRVKESAEMSFDVPLIDIYVEGEASGYRIEASGFDFSGLGAQKSLLATENMRRLAEKLHLFSSRAALDDDYRNARVALSRVWGVEERKDPGGVKRNGLGSFRRKNVVVINNSMQFNRYSRLRRNLL